MMRQLFSKKNPFSKGGELLYRKIRHSKGYGVHSPFVYNLITRVIEEKGKYYRFEDIESYRKRLHQNEEWISVGDRRNPQRLRRRSIAELVRSEAISPKLGALLFRLTNHFRPRNILQVGSSMGLSTLYLTSYASELTCVSLEPDQARSHISQWVYNEAARSSIDLRIGDYMNLLPGVLKEIQPFDFIFFANRNEQLDLFWLFTTCLPYAQQETLFVLDGIHSNREAARQWKQICQHPEVTVTLDLYAAGIVFIDKKLHKRNYKVYY